MGTRVPQDVQLYSVPQSLAVEVPAARAYKYMMVNGRVVLVDQPNGRGPVRLICSYTGRP